MGGNDGSLQFEQAFGSSAGLQSTIIFLVQVHNATGASVADIINLAGILSVAACNGPSIPITYGRIDATQQSLENDLPNLNAEFSEQLAFFQNAGMSEIDLVTLGMGGHTIG